MFLLHEPKFADELRVNPNTRAIAMYKVHVANFSHLLY